MTQAIDTILLDRDGTLIEEQHYLRDPERVFLLPGVQSPWRQLTEQGCRFFLITNQSGIGRGTLTLNDYHRVHARLVSLLAAQGLTLTDAAYCPHSPDRNCDCRKPRTGLWGELAKRHDLIPERTVVIGDKIADIRFGQAVGCRETVLVLTGHGQDEAARLGLPALASAVQRCSGRPDWPTFQARTLGDYLQHLVQNTTHPHAHRI